MQKEIISINVINYNAHKYPDIILQKQKMYNF
jgi:hypothetical protein